MAKRIIVAVIFVPILLVIMLFLPPAVWTVVVAFISGMAAFEFLRATGDGKVSAPMEAVTILSAVLIPLSCGFGVGTMTTQICAFLVMAVSFCCAIRAYDEEGGRIGFFQVLITLFGGVMIPLGLSSLVILKCMAFITDGGAYFAGVFLGKHRGITKVSPNKSLEGYIGGLVTGIVFALIYGLVVSTITGLSVNYLSLVLCGLLGAVATELGDLAFSLIKRQYGVKDYGHLLPGHGGMLDRFDSMIFCAPVVLFVIHFLPVF